MDRTDVKQSYLLQNMGIFFIPAGVGLIANFDTLAQTWWQLIIVITLTTTLMIAFVGKVVQTIKRYFDKKQMGEVVHQLKRSAEQIEEENSHVE